MEKPTINPKERIGREPRPIHGPVILWFGNHPLVAYPGVLEDLPAMNFVDANGQKKHTIARDTPITIGRSRRSTIQFPNYHPMATASGHHAEINLRDSLWEVEDSGSLNGTFVEAIPRCPEGQTLLPKTQWRVIPDDNDPIISLGGWVSMTLEKESSFLFLSTLAINSMSKDGPVFQERTKFLLPPHEPIRLGTSAFSDVVINHPYISANHATVINTGNGVLIHDKSVNGTRVTIIPQSQNRL